MKLFSSLNEITEKVKNAFLRFPITLVWAIFGTLFTIWFVDQKIDNTIEFKYIKIILTAVLGLSWLIATRLLIHFFKEEKSINKFWVICIPLIFLALYYFNLPSEKDTFESDAIGYRFVLYLITGHLTIFFSPFLFKWDKIAYWNYLKSIFIAFARSVIFSLVIYLGLTIALMALKFLFKFEIKSIRYFQLFIFCLGIINTAIFLSDAPRKIHQQKTIDYPKALLVFVKYILIPLTLLYLVILYTYSIKILINWSLPKGWVSYLVIALSVLGFLIHILINPIRKTSESRVINKFYPWFYYALLPLTALLFIAILKRISDYGFTEKRYLVLVLSCWILGMTLYILLSKRKQLRYLPMTVAIISMLVSFGFWGMFSVSQNSQIKQFEKMYLEIKASNFKVKSDLKSSFESTTRYLSKRNALNKVQSVLGFDPKETFKGKNSYSLAYKLIDSLNIEVTDFDKNNLKRSSHYYQSEIKNITNVKGYDFLKNVNFYYNKNNIRNTKFNENDNYSFILNNKTRRSIIVFKNRDTLHEVELKSFIKSLKSNQYNQTVPNEKMTVERDFEGLKLKIIFQSIEIQTKDDTKIIPAEIRHGNAVILWKEK